MTYYTSIDINGNNSSLFQLTQKRLTHWFKMDISLFSTKNNISISDICQMSLSHLT